MLSRLICYSFVCSLVFLVCSTSDKRLLWIPNNEGLVSQFVQLKVVQHFAHVSKRKLVSASFSTPHLPHKRLMMCDVFELPDVTCDEQLKCQGGKYQFLDSDKADLCIAGSVPAMGGDTRRDTLLHGIKLAQPTFTFQKQHDHAVDLFRINLGITKGTSYTVVHWRRGDQLMSRCRQTKDTSVNCGSAQELVDLVRAHTNDSLVYVATNELSNSSESILLAAAGFKLFHHGLSAAFKVSPDSVTGIVIDTSLMLNCNTFLGWGISLVNDVVEHQRMLEQRSYCVAYSEHNTDYPTWCWLRHQEQKPENSFIVSQAPNVGGVPFLALSSFNTSRMPTYEKEREGKYGVRFKPNIV